MTDHERSRRKEGIALGTLVILGWSFPGVFVRMMPSLAWHEATGLRLGVAMVAALPLMLAIQGSRRSLSTALRSPLSWLLAFTMVAYYATATAAFTNAPVGEVALLIASAPAWAALWHFATGHRDNRHELWGAVVAIAGVGLVSVPAFTGDAPAPGNHVLGVLLSIGSAMCAAVYSISVGRAYHRGVNPGSSGLGWLTFLLGSLLLLPWSFEHLAGQMPLYWPQALGLGILSTALPTIAYAAASERLPRGLTTIFNPAVSVTANLAATMALGEVPSFWALPGGVLVLTGVVMTLRLPKES